MWLGGLFIVCAAARVLLGGQQQPSHTQTPQTNQGWLASLLQPRDNRFGAGRDRFWAHAAPAPEDVVYEHLATGLPARLMRRVRVLFLRARHWDSAAVLCFGLLTAQPPPQKTLKKAAVRLGVVLVLLLCAAVVSKLTQLNVAAAARISWRAPLLDADDFEATRERALEAVEVPASVLQVVVDLRNFLQVRACVCKRAGVAE